MSKVHPIGRPLWSLRHETWGLGHSHVFRRAVGRILSFERLGYCWQISEVKSLLVCTKTPRTGEPDVIVGTVWITALETGGVLSSLVIFELNRGWVTETRALTASDRTDEGSPPILGLESLQFGWGQANPTRSTDKRLDGAVVVPIGTRKKCRVPIGSQDSCEIWYD